MASLSKLTARALLPTQDGNQATTTAGREASNTGGPSVAIDRLDTTADAQTLYYGRKPRQVRVYDKTRHSEPLSSEEMAILRELLLDKIERDGLEATQAWARGLFPNPRAFRKFWELVDVKRSGGSYSLTADLRGIKLPAKLKASR